jgi:phosphatidylinositol dimannoside acyltransferase
MRDRRAGMLLRTVEGAAYWAAGAWALACLPAVLGYRIACWRGDVLFHCQAAKRTEVARNMRLALGSSLSPAAAQQVVRDWFRFNSCQAVDLQRLRRDARPLRRLVEIRGREHLESALAAGKGAILCSAHFGSDSSGFAVLHTSGFPITTIGRTVLRRPDRSPAERRFWSWVYRRVRRYRQRPVIEPLPGRVQVAAQAAVALRADEVVTISIDAPPLDGDRARAIEVPFLGGTARLLPGAVTLAQLTGAPLLIGLLYRAADYRHQVWEISAPVPVEGDAAAVFERCVAEVSAAIQRSPAHWNPWDGTSTLASLGLIQPQADSSPAELVLPVEGKLPDDGPADNLPVPDLAGGDLSRRRLRAARVLRGLG